jgi:guanylate kinase
MKTDMHYGAPAGVFRQAQIFRNNPTPAEAALWEHLRKNQMKFRFRRQHPIWMYVVDFYCHFLRLVIEVDGGIHEEPDSQLYDEERNQNIIGFGIHILRFTNEQVLFDMDTVLSEIAHTIDKLKYLSKSSRV